MFIVTLLVILSVLIVVHEWGHFYVAKRLGIRVERFSVGFGPRLLSIKGKETEYRLSLILFGGYVRLGGESREEGLKGEKWEYLSRSVGERFLVVFAGPFLNYLLAFFIFTAVFMMGNPQLTSKIGKVIEKYPAYEAGILEGDRVLSIQGKPIRYWDEVVQEIRRTPEGQRVRVAVLRDEKELVFAIQPKRVEEKNLFGETRALPKIGIAPSHEVVSVKYPVHRALGMGMRQVGQVTFLTLKAIGRMVTGHMPLKELTGPIGIFEITREAAHLGLAYLLQMVALISTSLAIFNVLPIPVLDGGHLFFLILERLKGSPVNERVQEISRQVGLVLILALMMVVCYNDVSRFKVVERLSRFFGGS